MALPFEGMRSIDITHVLAGPFAAYQLGLMGADVIKVEHPDDPDQSRDSGTDNDLNHARMGTGFLTQGSNKRAITLNLKTEQGRAILSRIAPVDRKAEPRAVALEDDRRHRQLKTFDFHHAKMLAIPSRGGIQIGDG